MKARGGCLVTPPHGLLRSDLAGLRVFYANPLVGGLNAGPVALLVVLVTGALAFRVQEPERLLKMHLWP